MSLMLHIVPHGISLQTKRFGIAESPLKFELLFYPVVVLRVVGRPQGGELPLDRLVVPDELAVLLLQRLVLRRPLGFSDHELLLQQLVLLGHVLVVLLLLPRGGGGRFRRSLGGQLSRVKKWPQTAPNGFP